MAVVNTGMQAVRIAVNYGAYRLGKLSDRNVFTRAVYDAGADLAGSIGRNIFSDYRPAVVRAIIDEKTVVKEPELKVIGYGKFIITQKGPTTYEIENYDYKGFVTRYLKAANDWSAQHRRWASGGEGSLSYLGLIARLSQRISGLKEQLATITAKESFINMAGGCSVRFDKDYIPFTSTDRSVFNCGEAPSGARKFLAEQHFRWARGAFRTVAYGAVLGNEEGPLMLNPSDQDLWYGRNFLAQIKRWMKG